jgi:glycine/D-amino acid oxidase-like deaminating enzyme
MDRMKASKIHYQIYEKKQLKDLIPNLAVDFSSDDEAALMNLREVSYGLYGGDCGVVDPTRFLEFYLSEFVKMTSVKPRYGINVTGLVLDADPKLELPGEPLVWQNKRIVGVTTNKGQIRADTIVLATDAWSNALLDPVGIDSRTKAKKRQMFVIHAGEKKALRDLLFTKGFNKIGCIPFTILPSAGVYFRPQLQEKGFWIGCADKLGRAYDYVQKEDYATAESSYYENSIYPVLSKYLPAFQSARPSGSWGGGYSYSPDAIPYVYKESGMIVANGTSGSGIMKADALARIVNALYRGQKEAELYDGKSIPANALSIKERCVEDESVII